MRQPRMAGTISHEDIKVKGLESVKAHVIACQELHYGMLVAECFLR